MNVAFELCRFGSNKPQTWLWARGLLRRLMAEARRRGGIQPMPVKSLSTQSGAGTGSRPLDVHEETGALLFSEPVD
jgi:hypothetical protein